MSVLIEAVPMDKSLQRNRRVSGPSSICLHTRLGISNQTISTEVKDNQWHAYYPKRCFEASKLGRIASAHFGVGPSGKIGGYIDPKTKCAYHATVMNERSIGIEMYQEADGTIYETTLVKAVELVEDLCVQYGIARVIVTSQKIDVRFASPDHLRKYEYMDGGELGRLFSGVFGHRNVTRNRGPGDPGDEIINRLLAVGFEGV